MARARAYIAAGTDGQFFKFVSRYKWRWGVPLIFLGAAWCGVLLRNLEVAVPAATAMSLLVVLNIAVLLALAVRMTHLRVLGRQDRIARSMLIASVFRVVGTAGLFGLGEPALFLAWNAAVSTVSLLVIGRLGPREAPTAELRSSFSAELPIFRHAARRAVPIAVALIAAEQTCTWLIATRGGSVQIASIIALTRFAAIFSLVNSINIDWIVPRFAAATDSRSGLRKKLVGYALGYCGLLLAVGGALAVASPLILWTLGPQYQELNVEFCVVISGVICSQFAYGLNALNLSRGWVAATWVYPVALAVWVAASLQIGEFDIMGAAVVYATLPVALLVTQLARSVIGLHHTPGGRGLASVAEDTRAMTGGGKGVDDD